MKHFVRTFRFLCLLGVRIIVIEEVQNYEKIVFGYFGATLMFFKNNDHCGSPILLLSLRTARLHKCEVVLAYEATSEYKEDLLILKTTFYTYNICIATTEFSANGKCTVN